MPTLPTYRKILLVGEDQKKSISQLVLVEHTLQLLAGLNDTVTIVAVDDEDDTLGVLEVMSPQRSDLVLSSNIPHGELDILILNSLDVETYSYVSAQDHGWGMVDVFAYRWLESW